MKTKQFIAFICFNVFLSITSLHAQAQLNLLKDSKTCLYGYTDAESNWIVQPEYDQAEEFYKYYAIVTKNDKSGLIDSSGTVVVPLIYENIKNMYNHFFVLSNDTLQSIFDLDAARITIQDIPYKIKNYKKDHALVYLNNSFGLYSKEGLVVSGASEIIFCYFNLATIDFGNSEKKEIRLFDLIQKSFITSQCYSNIDFQDSAYFVVKKNNLYGVIDRTEKTIIPFSYHQYTNLGYYGNFSFVLTDTIKNKAQLFDRNAQSMTKNNYNTITYSDEIYDKQSLIASNNTRHALIDYSGKELVACIYDSIVLIEKGYHIFAYVLYSKKGIQIADLKGTIINTGYYPNISYLKQLYAPSPTYYEDGTMDSEYESNYNEPFPYVICIHADSAITWLDLTSNTEYNSTDYEEEHSCSGLIYYNGKYGLISPDLKHVLLPTYDFIYPFKPGYTFTNVLNNDFYGIVTIEGHTIIQPEYAFIEQNPFSEELFIIRKDDVSWGIIDSNNHEFIRPDYSAITGYHPKMDYFWGINYDTPHWKILDKNQHAKSSLSFEYPVSLAAADYAVVRIYKQEDDVSRSGVINCHTLETYIPYEYEGIKKINDTVFICYKNTSTESQLYNDLFIDRHRIDSVSAICMLPDNVIAIRRNNVWGYYKNNNWAIAPGNTGTQSGKDVISLLNMHFQNNDETSGSYGEDVLFLFPDTLNNSFIHALANNKALEAYCNTQATKDDGKETESQSSITVYDDAYVMSEMDEKEFFEMEDMYHGGNYYPETYESTSITTVVLSNQLAEIRYFHESIDRHYHYIERENNLYTVKHDSLFALSLGDITNHIKGTSILSGLLLEKLDEMADIQLPCADRSTIVELATAYQFEKEGIRFYYTDERDENSIEYDEIEVVLLYAELIDVFQKSTYLKQLYTASLKP